jgi:hypothetical protein
VAAGEDGAVSEIDDSREEHVPRPDHPRRALLLDRPLSAREQIAQLDRSARFRRDDLAVAEPGRALRF